MLGWVWAFPLTFILLGYLVPHFLVGLLPSQDLKKKARRTARSTPLLRGRAPAEPPICLQYGATWALVTGASSGRQLSTAERWAQGTL